MNHFRKISVTWPSELQKLKWTLIQKNASYCRSLENDLQSLLLYCWMVFLLKLLLRSLILVYWLIINCPTTPARRMWCLVYTEEIAEIWEIFLHLELSIMPWLGLKLNITIRNIVIPNIPNAAKSSNTPEEDKQRKEKHKCGVTQCPVCQEDVDIRTHKCFIQSTEEEQHPRNDPRFP